LREEMIKIRKKRGGKKVVLQGRKAEDGTTENSARYKIWLENREEILERIRMKNEELKELITSGYDMRGGY